MELDETLAFVAVLDAGSFTAAAKRLDVPKSTLSRRVSRLEERLGARLLQRTTRRISPTETGRAYFERCHAAIEEIRDAFRKQAFQRAIGPRGGVYSGRVTGIFQCRFVPSFKGCLFQHRLKNGVPLPLCRIAHHFYV